MVKTTPAFAYLRVSSTGQLDGHGLERQEAAVGDFARRAGFRVVEVFSDSHTGTEADRPAFGEMLGALRANGTKTVLIERLDRFAREIGVQIALLGLLQREGVTLIEATTGRDVTAAMADDPMAKALVSIQGVFHQAEKELLVRRLRKAREAVKAKTGRCGGSYPIGEDPSRPDEKEVVVAVRKLSRKPRGRPRLSAQQIAAELDQMGLQPRSGGRWSRHTIRRIQERLGLGL